MTTPINRPYSSRIVDGVEQAPSRAMLYPVGFTEAYDPNAEPGEIAVDAPASTEEPAA